MADQDGYLADYLDADELRTVLVVQEAAAKLSVIEQFGKQRTIKASQVLCRYQGAAARAELQTAIPALHERVATHAAGIDSELLWEDLEPKEKELACAEIADRYFGAHAPEQCSAVFRALSADPIRFRRNGLLFSARTAAQVDSLRLNQQRQQERQVRETEINAWIDGLYDETKVPAETAGMDENMAALRDYLVERRQSDIAKIFAERFPENPFETAYEVLERAGVLPPGSNPIRLIAGINPEFNKQVLADADALPVFDEAAEPRGRIDLRELPAFSIDDETTREIDDALTVEMLEGKVRIGIHIADVTDVIEQHSALDLEARSRTLTIYLPETTHTMFPERVGCDLASLNEGVTRRALSLLAEFDNASGDLLDWKFAGTLIRSAHRLTYARTDAILGGEAHPAATLLKSCHDIAERLRQKRLAAGAFLISRPELRVHVEDGEISLHVNRGSSASQVLVQEMMILYNSLAAKKAVDEGIPVIYRVQAAPEGRDFPAGREIEYAPHTAGALFKCIRPARLSLEPGPHSGLGVPGYIQASSPIRRYADLVMQRQLTAAVADRRPVYEQGELYRILAAAEGTSKEISAIERRSIRFWALEYLSRNCLNEDFTATVVQNQGGQAIVELDRYPLRAVLTGAKPAPGENVAVRIKLVDARKDILNVEPG